MTNTTTPGTQRLTRSEAKALTRARLLDAALDILDAEGEAGLTTTKVTRRAGISQSSFYVHFEDMNDLLHELIDQLAAERRRSARVARRDSRSDPSDPERYRDTFRVPIAHSVAHPQMFRLLLRAQHDQTSPLGEWSREVAEDTRQALVDDLIAAGLPSQSPLDRRRAEMIADGIMALTNAMILGHLEGRYPDVEEAIDVLVTFSTGYLALLACEGGDST